MKVNEDLLPPLWVWIFGGVAILIGISFLGFLLDSLASIISCCWQNSQRRKRGIKGR